MTIENLKESIPGKAWMARHLKQVGVQIKVVSPMEKRARVYTSSLLIILGANGFGSTDALTENIQATETR